MMTLPGNEMLLYPEEHNSIKVSLLNGCCIAHPSVMIRRAFLIEFNLRYDRAMEPSEDFDLWTKIIRNGTFYNIPKPLISYRTHENQTSELRRVEQRLKAQRIQARHLTSIATKTSAVKFYDVEGVRLLTCSKKKIASIRWLERQCQFLKRKNKEQGFFDDGMFSDFLDDYSRKFIRAVFLTSFFYHPDMLWFYMKVIKKYPTYFSIYEKQKVMLKCLIFHRAGEGG
jgi:hypothetical protein